MGRTFYPGASKYVEASAPHPEGTQYKVSIGNEDWDGQYCQVIKVQMVYNGKVAGRKSPSYPFETDDYLRVASAISELKDEEARRASRVVFVPASPALSIPASEYTAIICTIPSGKITRLEDIEAYLCRRHHVQRVEIVYFPCPPFDMNGNAIPYWRVVGTHGFLFDERGCNKETKAEYLTKEGLTIEPAGAGGRSLRVAEYKKHLVNLRELT